jgi:mannose-6-phosphate isomerase
MLHKPIGVEGDYGESWELSDHPEAPTLIASGEFAGCTLSEVIGQNPEAMYGAGTCYSTFPLLIKFIDATDRLSLQVHPDDSHLPNFDARKSGKSEAWVILDAAPDSRIYAGLKAGIDESTLRSRLEQGNVEDCLHSYPVRPGDSVFIPAGTLHAIGEGILLAEVQQTSDITYRVFDWNRLDQSGQPRPLHVEQAFQSINFQRGPVDLLHPQSRQSPGHKIEDLLESSCFTIRRHHAAKLLRLPALNRAQILIILEGSGHLDCSAETFELAPGKTLLVPAAASDCEIVLDQEMTFLEVIPG